MKPLHWTNLVVKVPPFTDETTVELSLPCSLDFDVAANKYFYGLDTGSIDVAVMFSGTIFYTGENGAVQISQIPWDREAHFKLPVEAWKAAIDAHYPDTTWLRLPRDTFDRLYRYKVAQSIPFWADVLDRLLDQAEQNRGCSRTRRARERTMNFSPAEAIADAVLFEGYILYPYRPSAIKNRQRWNFGTLYPQAFAEAQTPPERSQFCAEVLFEAGQQTTLSARARFLQLVSPSGEHAASWEEGFARSRALDNITLSDLLNGVDRIFDLSSLSDEERPGAPAIFNEKPRQGRLMLRAMPLHDGFYRLHALLANESYVPQIEPLSRRIVQDIAFTSAHLLLGIEGGSFVSLLEPHTSVEADAKACQQDGVFPVLAAAAAGDRSCVLCSPIILYDYPQIAPESIGNFFDGTEMDEMLALRVLTLTDEEKAEMRRSDPHTRAILERTETLPDELLAKVHGAVRGLRRITEHEPTATTTIDLIEGPFDPFADRPPLESVRVFGAELRVGDRVRLWPQKKADILDMAMEGKIATIEAIEQDLEDNIQFAVVLEDDPGRDMGMLRQPGHRFFFTPEEVEPLELEAS